MNRDVKNLILSRGSRHIRKEMWYSRKRVSVGCTRERAVKRRAFLGYADVRMCACQKRDETQKKSAAENPRTERYNFAKYAKRRETETEKERENKEMILYIHTCPAPTASATPAA